MCARLRAVSAEITTCGVRRRIDPQQRQRHQLAVAREHGVGARELQQRHRDAVPVGHGGLLDRPPALVRAHAAAGLAREAEPRRGAEADRSNMFHIASAGSDSAILAAPTLDDFWITCSTVSMPRGMRVVDGCLADGEAAGRGLRSAVCGVTRPDSRATAMVNGLSVEPGSKVSVMTRLRSCAPDSRLRLFGL